MHSVIVSPFKMKLLFLQINNNIADEPIGLKGVIMKAWSAGTMTWAVWRMDTAAVQQL